MENLSLTERIYITIALNKQIEDLNKKVVELEGYVSNDNMFKSSDFIEQDIINVYKRDLEKLNIIKEKMGCANEIKPKHQ